METDIGCLNPVRIQEDRHGCHRRGDREDQGNDRLGCATPRRPAAQGERTRRGAGAVAQLPAGGGARAVADPDPRCAAGRRHLCHQPGPAVAPGGAELRGGLPPRRHGAGVPRGAPDPGTGRHGDGGGPHQRQSTGRTQLPVGCPGRAALGGGTGRRGPGLPPRDRAVLRQLGALFPARRSLRSHHTGAGLARTDTGGRRQPHPARAPGDPRRAAGPGRGGRTGPWATVHVASVEQWLRSTL
ncbi:hypothetical protein ACVWXU_007398 [Streptomyces sp. TE33382]